MLVAISGSQGSGKTTVLNELAKKGYHVVERKTSRSIQKDWGYTLEEINASKELTMKFQQEILERKRDDEAPYIGGNEVAFTERTFADIFTYALLVLGKEPSCSTFLDQYYTLCHTTQRLYYSQVFLLEAGLFPVEWDVNRASANKHYCKVVDRTLFDVTSEITEHNRVHVIGTADLNERVEYVLREINK